MGAYGSGNTAKEIRAQVLAEKSQCRRCLFRLEGKSTCVAYPKGIPTEIIRGQVDHTEPYPGDGGFRFLLMSGAFGGARRSVLAVDQEQYDRVNKAQV